MLRGALAILPFAIGVAAYGFAFGVLAAQAGFPWWGVALMSAGVHAGSSQIVAVDRFAEDGALWGAVAAGVLLNLRYLGICATLPVLFQGHPLSVRLGSLHVTGDENWALTMSTRARDGVTGLPFLAGSGLVSFLTWTFSTTIGAAVGNGLPDLEPFGLGFAFTAAFIAMARSLWRGVRDRLPWAVAFAVTLAAAWAGVPTAFAILIGAVSGLATAFVAAEATA